MPGTITALRFQKRNRDRVNLYLDGEYAFPLPAMQAARLHIGQELTEQEIEDLKAADLRSRGYDKAVRFLAVRPRSEAEVRRNLENYRPRDGRRLSAGQIEWIIQRLRQRSYLDDQAFARFWVEQRNRFRPLAPAALRYELRQKGVDATIIEETLEQLCNPATACEDAARSRMYKWRSETDPSQFRKKLGGFLQRRGFDWHTVREVTERLWQELEATRDS